MPPLDSLDPSNLPTDPAVLRAALAEALRQLKTEKNRNQRLEWWVEELRTRLFGRKSEKPEGDNQRLLQFLVEGVAARKPEPTPEPPPPAPEPDKKGHGRAKIPKDLLRNEVVHDVPKKGQRCRDCRKVLIQIGEVTSERVEYVPACIHVERDVRLKYACPDPECRGTILLAPLPPRAVPKCKAAEGLIAYLVWQKYGAHKPLYRLQEDLANYGFPVHRSSMWEWLWGAALALEPITSFMTDEVKDSPVIETDETPVPLWDRERKVLRVGRQWVYNNPVHTVYEFTVDRKGKHPAAFLADSKGTLLSDAYSAYRTIARKSGGRLKNAFCMAHLRRLFWKAMGTDRDRALVGMAYIRALYDVEDEGRDLTPSKRKVLRQKKSKPILGKFEGWLKEQGPAVLPKSPIGKAISYAIKNWKELCLFTEDGRIRIDNNRSEQTLRPWALGRKNWLRFQSERGGKVAAIFGSLIASCRRHKKNPFEYLRDVLRRIPAHPPDRLGELTTARWKPKPERPRPKPDTS